MASKAVAPVGLKTARWGAGVPAGSRTRITSTASNSTMLSRTPLTSSRAQKTRSADLSASINAVLSQRA
jgi:hypothetical protein